MDKRDYFLKALNDGAYKKRDWILSCFSLFNEKPDEWKEDPYAYRVVVQDDKHFFVDPDYEHQLTQITGTVPGEPAFGFKEKLTVTPGEVANLKQQIETSYGNLLYNFMILINAFGDKIEYQQGKVDPKKIEKYIAANLVDTPVSEDERDPSKIHVDELLAYGEAMGALAGLTQLCVPSASQKTVSIDPAIIQRRDELIQQHKDELGDPAVVAKIEKELTDMYMEYMEGDEAEGFFIKDKTGRVAMKKSFLMHGIETGFGDSAEDVEVITKSLNEGWQINKMPSYFNTLRAGSYSRGAQTELGGMAVKTFHRVFQNTEVAEPDCGTKTGLPWVVSEINKDLFEGQYEVVNGKPIRIESGAMDKRIGEKIYVRSPMLCITEEPSFCATCIGDKYGQNPNGLGTAAAEVGSAFMSSFMAAMHAKELTTAELRLDEAIT